MSSPPRAHTTLDGHRLTSPQLRSCCSKYTIKSSYFLTLRSLSITGRKSGHGGGLLTSLLPKTYLAYIFTPPKTTSLKLVPPTVGWASPPPTHITNQEKTPPYSLAHSLCQVDKEKKKTKPNQIPPKPTNQTDKTSPGLELPALLPWALHCGLLSVDHPV